MFTLPELVLENPFRTSGVIRPPFFANREKELKRLEKALKSPGGKLIVSGERRMGKTSALVVALDRHRAAGGFGLLADFSTGSTAADLANRLLNAATQEIGRRWRNKLNSFFRHLKPEITLGTDAAGQPTARFALGLREASRDAQYETLAAVLDALERTARDRKEVFAIVLDEFQEIHGMGGEEAEWRLRGAVQHHQQLSYVFAGSKPSLIRRMQLKNRAFYQLADRLSIGRIEPAYLASWIDTRTREAGLNGTHGSLIVRLAGPRTRDVVQLARKAFDLGSEHGRVEVGTIRAAFTELIVEEDDSVRLYWSALTSAQQNVLRAIAAGEAQLTSQGAQRRFALPTPAAVRKALQKFEEDGIIIRRSPAGGYDCDSPFVRGWLIQNALPDLGILQDPTEVEPK